jgi:hypothetical protein
MTIENFKNDCVLENSDVVVQKYLIEGESFFFKKFYNDNEEFSFKKELANSLNVHIRDIAIIGSGKLGYSIKPDENSFYQFKSFDFNHTHDSDNEKSDLDVAIISSRLFDKQLVSIYEHTDCYRDTEFNSKGKRASFGRYILQGWLNTEHIPDGYVISNEIIEAQNIFENKYKREINYGIYKSWYFFEKYHINNIDRLKLNLIAIG